MKFLPYLVLALAGGALAQTGAPAMPRLFLDTTYSPPAGATITVDAGGSLQAAIDRAKLGDTIVLQAGATYAGPIVLPNKTAGAGWIHIRSSAYASLPPPGSRVAFADAVNMPKITVAGDHGIGAIATRVGAHHFRFVGIEVKPVAGHFIHNLVDIGNADTALASLPHDIVFDRCYIHGDPATGGRRGVAMNGIGIAVIDSHVSDFKERGADTQALWAYNTPGPLKMVNNYLEAAGENIMLGGADPRIANVVPSDIEVRGNYIAKPLAWRTQPWSVKNLFELKNAQRILVEGNVFENNWRASQNGFAILVTPRNQDGKAPWSITQDITFRLNRILNVGQGFNLSGRDDGFPSQVTRRVLIENNLVVVTRLQGADGRIFVITGGPMDSVIRHNTAVITVAGGTAAFVESNPRADQFVFTDNLLSSGAYGFPGTGTGTANQTLAAYFTNHTFTKNAFIGYTLAGGQARDMPAGNLFPADIAAVGFADAAGGDYTLVPGSPYRHAGTNGGDIGADMPALAKATRCTVDGRCSP